MNADWSDLKFWRWTSLFGKGYLSYAEGVLEREGPFGNPARMVEDMHDQFYAGVWAHAGWWDRHSDTVHDPDVRVYPTELTNRDRHA